jgi:hypothetical protein
MLCAEGVRRYSHPKASPPRCAKYPTPLPAPIVRIPDTRLRTTSIVTIHFTFIGTTPNSSTSSSGQRIAYASITPNTAADAPTSRPSRDTSRWKSHPPSPHQM